METIMHIFPAIVLFWAIVAVVVVFLVHDVYRRIVGIRAADPKDRSQEIHRSVSRVLQNLLTSALAVSLVGAYHELDAVKRSVAVVGSSPSQSDNGTGMARDLKAVRADLEQLTLAFSAHTTGVSNSAVQFIKSASLAYDAMRMEVAKAKGEVRTMHLRSIAPPLSQASEDYQNCVTEWAKASDHKAFRIINTSGESLLKSARKMLADAKENPRNYHVGGLEWKYHTPFLNLVIADDQVAFVCIYQLAHEEASDAGMTAIRISDPGAVEALSNYHKLLFQEAVKDKELEAIVNAKR